MNNFPHLEVPPEVQRRQGEDEAFIYKEENRKKEPEALHALSGGPSVCDCYTVVRKIL
jgi:hypothetical protein